MKVLNGVWGLTLLIVLVACGNNNSKDSEKHQGGEPHSSSDKQKHENQTDTLPSRELVDKTNAGDTAKVTIRTPGANLDEMRYDLDTLQIKAGQTIQLTLKNPAPKDADEMEHNWVVTKPGADQEVAAKGVKAGEDQNFLPKDKSNILAFTPIIEQQEETTITFSIEEAGEYPFICTHPEHYPAMKGTLTVVEPEAS